MALKTESPWLAKARAAYSTSTTYIDNNWRKTWEAALRHFNNKHAAGSKYLKPAFKYRSKIFRPKTRSLIRNNEAAVAIAMFGHKDMVNIKPMAPSSIPQQAAAMVDRELLTYRLQETIPWFQICIGGAQDAMNMGVVCSAQEWCYREKDVLVPTGEVIEGEPVFTKMKEPRKDEPVMRLVPIENLRIDPASDWTDPIESTPYIIELMPMYVKDVKARATDEYGKDDKWHMPADGDFDAATSQEWDSTRLTREGDTDRMENDGDKSVEISDFTIVWVHRVIMEHKGEDLIFYTLGTEFLLSEPRPLEELFLHGTRPYALGCAMIEAHRLFKSGHNAVARNMQQEINENVNQRSDNVKLVLNKRWFIKRGAQVDIRSITRNVPGSGTLMNDPTGDVVPQDFSDITSSAYQEQDRLNLDFDELLGMFSASTVQSNRSMNETVGGMGMLQNLTNMLTEYFIKTLIKTWAEPALKQIVALNKAYETNQALLAVMADRARLQRRFGIQQITDQLLQQPTQLTINAGFGSSNPFQRVNLFFMALERLQRLLLQLPPGAKPQEIVDEVFGRLGYDTGEKFFDFGEDGQSAQHMMAMQQMQQQIAMLQQQVAEKQSEQQVKLATAEMKEAGQDRRKAADIRSDLLQKSMDLYGQQAQLPQPQTKKVFNPWPNQSTTRQ